MKTINYTFFIFIALASFISCTEIVDINLEEAGDSKLVVFGEITNEPKQHAVYLSKSTPYFYNLENPAVSGATVTISDGNKIIILTEDQNEPGTYLTPNDYAGIPGKTYQLTIENIDIEGDGISENYRAETVMKGTPLIDGVDVVFNDSWNCWEVRLFAHEPGETTDFYLFKVLKNDSLYTDTISDYWTVDDRFFNGRLISGPMVQYFDKDKEEIVNPGDLITLEMYGITEEYYDFINGLQLEVSEKIPIFSGPSANVKGNISNGALGFFAATSLSRGWCRYSGK